VTKEDAAQPIRQKIITTSLNSANNTLKVSQEIQEQVNNPNRSDITAHNYD
jgi:hypothetical protein